MPRPRRMPGDWVSYTPPHNGDPNRRGIHHVGRVVRTTMTDVVFVVFECDRNWTQFREYTAQACYASHLSTASPTEVANVGGIVLDWS